MFVRTHTARNTSMPAASNAGAGAEGETGAHRTRGPGGRCAFARAGGPRGPAGTERRRVSRKRRSRIVLRRIMRGRVLRAVAVRGRCAGPVRRLAGRTHLLGRPAIGSAVHRTRLPAILRILGHGLLVSAHVSTRLAMAAESRLRPCFQFSEICPQAPVRDRTTGNSMSQILRQTDRSNVRNNPADDEYSAPDRRLCGKLTSAARYCVNRARARPARRATRCGRRCRRVARYRWRWCRRVSSPLASRSPARDRSRAWTATT